jgi:type IV pilus assembly protein PilE
MKTRIDFPSCCRRGFTLVEMMIVLVVLAVLMAIALPAYQEQVRKGRRASAQSHLMDIAAKQQQFLLDNRRYAADLTSTELNLATPADVSNFFTITCCGAFTSASPPLFTATAAPKTGQTADLGGKTLSIDNANAKGPCLNDSTGAYTDAPCASGTTPVW